jgi:hypothetical protein
MDRGNRKRIVLLLILTLPAVIYIIIAQRQIEITADTRIDGMIGVMLGLYICSLAAADLLDMLFTRWPRLSKLTQLQWLALNAVFLLLGVAVIIMGTTRFTAKR